MVIKDGRIFRNEDTKTQDMKALKVFLEKVINTDNEFERDSRIEHLKFMEMSKDYMQLSCFIDGRSFLIELIDKIEDPNRHGSRISAYSKKDMISISFVYSEHPEPMNIFECTDGMSVAKFYTISVK